MLCLSLVPRTPPLFVSIFQVLGYRSLKINFMIGSPAPIKTLYVHTHAHGILKLNIYLCAVNLPFTHLISQLHTKQTEAACASFSDAN